MGCVNKCSISLRIYLKSSHNGDETGSFSKSLLRRRDKMADHIGTWENYASNIIVGLMMSLIRQTLGVFCSVCGLLMHKLIKSLLMPKKSV